MMIGLAWIQKIGVGVLCHFNRRASRNRYQIFFDVEHDLEPETDQSPLHPLQSSDCDDLAAVVNIVNLLVPSEEKYSNAS